jgi:hypothetical protein
MFQSTLQDKKKLNGKCKWRSGNISAINRILVSGAKNKFQSLKNVERLSSARLVV